MVRLGDQPIPPGFKPINYRQDPCDLEIGYPPARADRHSYVYQNLSQNLILKIRLAAELDVLKREIAMLQIAGENGLPVPEVRSQPTISNGWVSYTTSYITHKPNGQVDAQAAALVIAKLHTIRMNASQPLALYRTKLPANALIVLKHSQCDSQLAHVIKTKCLPLVEEVNFDMQRHFSLVHGDLHLGNILPSQPTPSLVDLEHAGRGSPMSDVARIKHCQSRYSLDADWSERFISKYQQLCNHSLDKLDKYLEYYDWVDVLNLWIWLQKGVLQGYEAELKKRLNCILYGSTATWIRPSQRRTTQSE